MGFVNDVFGKKQKKFILKERNIECLVSNIKELIENKEKFKELSDENLEESKKCDYDVIAKQFKEFFDYNLDQKRKENN